MYKFALILSLLTATSSFADSFPHVFYKTLGNWKGVRQESYVERGPVAINTQQLLVYPDVHIRHGDEWVFVWWDTNGNPRETKFREHNGDLYLDVYGNGQYLVKGHILENTENSLVHQYRYKTWNNMEESVTIFDSFIRDEATAPTFTRNIVVRNSIEHKSDALITRNVYYDLNPSQGGKKEKASSKGVSQADLVNKRDKSPSHNM